MSGVFDTYKGIHSHDTGRRLADALRDRFKRPDLTDERCRELIGSAKRATPAECDSLFDRAKWIVQYVGKELRKK